MNTLAKSTSPASEIWLWNQGAEQASFSLNGLTDTLAADETRAVSLAGITPWQIDSDETVTCAMTREGLPNYVAPERWPVKKDTLVGRISDADLPNVMAALASQPPEAQFRFNQSDWFWSDNATIRGLCAALGLDADVLLARDPLIT
jgi:hypothetical protein